VAVWAVENHVQDPYSFRYMFTARSAVMLVLNRNQILYRQSIYLWKRQIISAAIFHGQPLALALDFIAIALAELEVFQKEEPIN
jgi:histidine ammonia-lyase